MTPLLTTLGSYSLGAMSNCLTMFVPLKCTCMPCLLHVLLNFSPKPWMHGITFEMFLFCLLLLLFLLLLLDWASVWLLMLLWLCLSWNCCCTGLQPSWGTGKPWVLSLGGLVPWLGPLVCWIPLWPCGLECCIQCSWLLWSDCCPSVSTGLYVLVSCKPLCGWCC